MMAVSDFVGGVYPGALAGVGSDIRQAKFC